MTNYVEAIEKSTKPNNKQNIIHHIFESPIDINVINSEPIELRELIWNNYQQLPQRMKLINSGETLILLSDWFENTPYIQRGPLESDYVFSRIHFHWGSSAIDGSEHTVDGNRMPLEMHVIHYNKLYPKLEVAKRHEDGILFLVYFFDLKSNHNPVLDRILSKLHTIRKFDTEVSIEPFIIEQLIKPFTSDYYLYKGTIATESTSIPVLWLITRQITTVSAEQMQLFHQLMKENTVPIYDNCRKANSPCGLKIFYVNPLYRFTNSTLSPIPILHKQQF